MRMTCGPMRMTCGPMRMTCGPMGMTCGPTHAGETMPGKLWGKLRSTVYEGERTLRLMGSFAFTPGDEVIVGTTVNSGRWRCVRWRLRCTRRA